MGLGAFQSLTNIIDWVLGLVFLPKKYKSNYFFGSNQVKEDVIYLLGLR